MTRKTVVDVGNCDLDHDSLCAMLDAHFQVSVIRAHSVAEAIDALRASDVDLLLVNRKLDRDQADGLTLIQEVKADPALASTACMLISNFGSAQQAASAAGAEVGFGKQQLRDPQTVALLSRFLA